ncbi:MAG: nucleotide exchange factor GrpE [Gammaproteobacteria bacterium]|nr:nucleotide exchange factor GrpE [Gammaproteobacteria bacterium]MBU6508618.1 nucleotide exchange factor GrpE [Gammaproteobacteria bacterium]MDE1983105.1 nucleotide exchange factor GrpE [Gammaproteobacteria bacterium]MDE2107594.1 nucleotide exchange factor GrpE [Gammaproteobacteria bacterium]MDE2460670.1 nucleotide exchange factor GrpE [Gammaproteobacteria bacterium]
MEDSVSKKQAAHAEQAAESAAAPPEPLATDSTTELKTALTEARGKAAQNWEGYVRAVAELDNLRKRSQRDIENAHKYGLERFAQELLPVKDSLEAGIAAAASSAEGLREGLDLTLKMLTTALERFGVSEVNPAKAAAFNPELHEAMTMQPSTEAPPGSVLLTVQKGYLLNDRLLRPARVIVAKSPDAAA